jgi:two-component system, cell cycle sensor histidine kinase and response regulator CckA
MVKEAIRGLVAPVLRRHGFTVLEAADGVEAMAVAERHAGPIHLLLTDWCMPRLTGGELIRRLCKGRPETAILVMTGEMYVDTLSMDPVLHKPFKPQDLMDAVGKALDSRRQGTPRVAPIGRV